MNILFYTAFRITPTKGGTEHTTLTVASQLHNKYGCKCWALHSVDEDKPDCGCFEKQLFYKGRDLKSFLKDILVTNEIDVVLSEGSFYITKKVDELRKEYKLSVKNIFVHHFSPGWEENFDTKIDYLERVKECKRLHKIKAIIKCILFPYFRRKYLKSLPIAYNRTYQAADSVILLTQDYIPLYQEYGNFKDDRKFKVIPNALSLPDILNKDSYANVKKNIVLVVARLEEIQKRISLVLKIWEQVSKNEIAKDWQLLIGGEGIYRRKYEKYVKEHSIQNIKFVGRVNPIPYYKESSVFMMTSRSEGFPLTLNEAMQYGVVPLAFDSFESLRDIIDDGENGYIIPDLDIKTYCEKLLGLMANESLRHNMAMNALDSCKRYLPERIGDMWWKLLK